MRKIEFSIIIPLYNKEKYITHTVQSVLNQTFQNFELIIVDDGSTDSSYKVASTFKDDRIKLVTKKNGGVSSARNFGVELAKNEYIAFIDADDFWDKNYLKELSSLILACPEAKMFASSYAEIVEGKTIPSVTYTLLERNYAGYIDYISLFSKYFISPIHTSAVILHSSVFKSLIKFNENIKSGEDLLVWLAIAFQYKVAYLNKILSFYNRDLPIENKATNKLYSNLHSYIFIIKSVLRPTRREEIYLIDGLILRTLKRYYAYNLFIEEVKKVIASVDFSMHGFKWRIYYKLPKFICRFFYIFHSICRKCLK